MSTASSVISEVFIMETELTNAVGLGEVLIKGQILINIRELSLQRASVKINVEKSFKKVQLLLCTMYIY